MMRIASLTYDKARECQGCRARDEREISTYILSFQIAEQMLKRFGGEWNISSHEIYLDLKDTDYPFIINFDSGTLHYGSLMASYYHRYSPEKGISALIEDICSDLSIPSRQPDNDVDYMFKIFVKLIEIFHARCDLKILPRKTNGEKEWEICLTKDGPSGWVSEDGMAENRFGEKADIYTWKDLRPEKAATYLFGFNRFCKNFQCPMK